MRRAIFLVVILLAMSIPYAQADNENGVLFTWTGSASSVELIGEWDWNNTTAMSESGGVWSTSVELEAGLYGGVNEPEWNIFNENSDEYSRRGPGYKRIRASRIEQPVGYLDSNQPLNGEIEPGTRIFHQKYGYGIVKCNEGGKLEIDFEKAGTKKVMESFVESV